MNTVVVEDRDFVSDYYAVPEEDTPIEKMSPWLLRLVLSREMMTDKKLHMADIADRVRPRLPRLCTF